jgi:AraC-like DNA-binding protein
MKNFSQDVFLPLFVLQLPQKTLARYELDQADWVEMLASLLDIDVNDSSVNESLISLEDFCAIFRVGVARFGRESFLQSYLEDIRARHMGPVGLAMEAAPTIDDGLDIWRDNARMLAPMLDILARETAESRVYEVGYTCDMGDIADTYMELVLLMTAAIVRSMSGGTVIAEVRFAHAGLLPPAFYRDTLGLEPMFGQDVNSLTFDRGQSNRANGYYIPLMYQQALQGIRDLQENIRSHLRLSFRVRQFLQRRADEGLFPSLEEAAEQFNMAARTFTRHLADEGSSFRHLRTETQFTLAKRLLRKSSLPIKTVADRTGFANLSAFSRAFLAASGQTPQEYRRGDAAPGTTPADDTAG